MSLDHVSPAERMPAVEWPTLLLIVAIYAGFVVLTWFHAAFPTWIWWPLAIWISAWWGSAQHEILHGHPTRIRWINTALGTPPLWLWLPFEGYRRTHLTHHRDERLTDPLDDPESRYWTQDGWREIGPIGRALVSFQSMLAGRLLIGPAWSMAMYWREEIGRIRAKEKGARMTATLHFFFVALLLFWVVGICGLPFWKYCLAFAYGGTSLALVRSYAEHKARDHVDQRTAIVENSPVFALLFLNNNLHVLHHRWPGLPWYRLPALYRAHRETVLKANDGLVYDGYRDVFRRFFLRRHDQPIHPTGRAPLRDGSYPGDK